MVALAQAQTLFRVELGNNLREAHDANANVERIVPRPPFPPLTLYDLLPYRNLSLHAEN
jgi:hypothetical protein